MRSKPINLSREEIRSTLEYVEHLGIFKRKIAGKGVKVGEIAGSKMKDGYIMIKIMGERFFAHRLVFILKTGKDPEGCIDHINGNKSDNRFDNLRLATTAENGANRKPNDGRVFKGTTWDKRKQKWKAMIKISGISIHIGQYDSEIEAAAMYDDAAIKAFGDFARTNVSYV